MATLGEWDARKIWRDAPADFDALQVYMDAAMNAVLAYAPALPEGAALPDSYYLAQVLQARNLWNSAKASPGGVEGAEFGLVAYPLDWQVKQLLRPQRGMGAIV